MRIDETPARQAPSGKICLAIAIVLASAIQIIVVARSPAIGKDGIVFIEIARELKENPVETMRKADQHPGYPAMILAACRIACAFFREDSAETWISCGRAVSGAAGLLLIALVWVFARRMFGPREAAMAALILAVQPLFRENAADVRSDSVHLCLYLLALLLAAEGFIRGKLGWLAACGVCSSAAYWVRPEGLSVAVAAAGVAALNILRPGRRAFWAAAVASILLSAALASLPYMAIKGKLTTKKPILPRLSGAATLPEATRSADDGTRNATQRAASDNAPPGIDSSMVSAGCPFSARKLQKMAVALAKSLGEAFRYIFLVALVIGIGVTWRSTSPVELRRLTVALATIHLALLLLLYLAADYVHKRHAMPLVVLSMPWVSAGTLAVADRVLGWIPIARPALLRLKAESSCALLGLAIVAAMIPRSIRPIHAEAVPLLQAARWLEARADPGDAVLTNSPYIPFYSGLPGVVIYPKRGLPPWQSADGRALHRFVVFDPSARGFRRAWLDQLGQAYARYDVPFDPRKVVILVDRSRPLSGKDL